RVAAQTSRRIYYAAAAVAALLPAAIAFGTVVNNTIAFESMSLQPFARVDRGLLTAWPYAKVVAVWLAATLALLYVQVRDRLRSVVILALFPFFIVFLLGQTRIQDVGRFARSTLPAHTNWVDRATSSNDVLLIGTTQAGTAALETAYGNVSIGHL